MLSPSSLARRVAVPVIALGFAVGLFAQAGAANAAPTAAQPKAAPAASTGVTQVSTGAAAINALVFGINNCDGRREEFVRGSDNALWHRWQNLAGNNSSWTTWRSLGGVIIYDPSAARNSDCRLDVFAIGVNHPMFHRYQDGSADDGWSAWESLGGNLVSSPRNGYFSDGRIWVGAWGPDGIEHFKRQTAPSQGPWIGWY